MKTDDLINSRAEYEFIAAVRLECLANHVCEQVDFFCAHERIGDAHDEESGWHYPVILRFKDTDFVISWPGRKSDPAIDKNDGDAHLLVKNDLESDKANLGCFYLARIELFDCCHSEQLTALRYSIDGRSIQVTTEGHAICIS